jgi:hypothetical protein
MDRSDIVRVDEDQGRLEEDVGEAGVVALKELVVPDARVVGAWGPVEDRACDVVGKDDVESEAGLTISATSSSDRTFSFSTNSHAFLSPSTLLAQSAIISAFRPHSVTEEALADDAGRAGVVFLDDLGKVDNVVGPVVDRRIDNLSDLRGEDGHAGRGEDKRLDRRHVGGRLEQGQSRRLNGGDDFVELGVKH